ncbi:MAG: CDP-diacylglycerol--serine O-phosphatidyltransferase [Gammaproteobacteria bacterium]|nr:CDP-diacylglycerol--serine O-phosphatidyltransferase [Gammaproteobacteria bacterium]
MTDTEIKERRKRKRGIYLLPNLFTTAGLFAGFYSIVAAMGGRYEAAAIAIFVAMIMDGLDGRVARLTNTQSDFGAEYDSLSDMVAFGLAPALVMFEWSLSDLGKLGWLAAFVYTAAAALRLARFNTQIGIVDKKHFQGLPSPAAAAVMAGLVWVSVFYEGTGANLSYVAEVLTIAVALLMVSNIRYYSFKDLDLRGKVPFVAILMIVMIFVLVSLSPPQVLFLIFLGYMLSGPIMTVTKMRGHRLRRYLAARKGNKNNPDSEQD